MSLDLKIGSELAYLKQIMLIHTEMDVMMIFMAAEKTTTCILLVCEFLSEKLPLQMPKFPPNKHFVDSYETSSRQSNI